MWIEDDIENNDEDEPWKAKMSPPRAHLAPANAAITLPVMVNMDWKMPNGRESRKNSTLNL